MGIAREDRLQVPGATGAVLLRIAAITVTAWLATAGIACAAEAEEETKQTPLLGEVVVYGERVVPPTTVRVRAVEENAAKDVGELLGTAVPGVSSQRRGGSNLDPVLRGLRADRLNVLLDGTKAWGGGPFRMDPPTSLIDVDEVESIEVVKGPYSVTQGPGGLGGAILVNTKDPVLSETPEYHAGAGAGYTSNFDGWTVRGSTSAGGPSAAFRLGGGYRDFQDYESGDGERVPSGFRNRSLAGKGIWQPTGEDRLRLGFSIDSDRNASFASLPLYAEEDDAYLGSVTYARLAPWPSVEEIQAAGYYNYVHHRMTNKGKPTEAMMDVSFPLDARTYGGRVQADVRLPAAGELAVGGDIYRLEREGTSRMRFLMGPNAGKSMNMEIWPDTHILDGGLFAEVAYPFLSRFRAVVGARVDFVDADANPDQRAKDAFVRFYGPGADDVDAFEVNASANGRLILTVADGLELFTGIGRGVRTADATERFFVLGPGPGGYYIGNPRLDPEKSLETDVGISAWWRDLEVTGTFFYNRVDDYILQVVLDHTDVNMDGQPEAVRGFENIDLATLIGCEVTAGYAVREWLDLQASLAYVRGENQDDDEPLPEIPPLEGRIGARLRHALGEAWSFWLNPSVRLVDRQDRIDDGFGEDESAGFGIFDTAAGVWFLERYELVVTATNLFDKNYHEHLTREDPFTGREVPEPGRVVSVSVRAAL